MAIGTTAAIIGAAAIGAAGSVASGAMGSSAASKSAAAQERAATEASQAQVEAARISAEVQRESIASNEKLTREGIQFQKDQYQQARADVAPWMEAGRKALNQYQIELGLTPGPSAFQRTPGYDFMVDEGEKGVINNLAALGMKNSGAALKALTRFRSGLANQTYDNYLNRMQATAGMGQSQVNTTNALGQNVAGSVQQGLGSIGSAGMAGAANIGRTYQDAGQARATGYLNAGQAQASGYMGAANAWQNAISSGVGNVSNALGFLAFRGNNSLGGFPASPGVGLY